MEKTRFINVLSSVLSEEKLYSGIGTYQEKSIHKVLKYYFEPDDSYHEIKIGKYVADICVNQQILEIQTANFNNLRDKLTSFLPSYEVTIIYPIAKIKYLSYLNDEKIEKRKSPKNGCIQDIFKELYKIKSFLNHPHLHLKLVLLEEIEYRNRDFSSRKKFVKFEAVPDSLVEIVSIDNLIDYAKFVPLISEFTSSEYASICKVSLKTAQMGLNILAFLKVIKIVGKRGRAYIYQIS